MLLTLSLACGSPPSPTLPAPQVDRLSPREHTIRVSMAIRGIRPTAAEIAEVEADPAALEAWVDTWLETDAFGETIRDLHNAHLGLRDDAQVANWLPALGPLAGFDQAAINFSRGEAPLKLAETIVRESLPYTEMLTADWVMADPITAAAYGLPHDPTGPTWQRSAWSDGRPRAGMLSSTQWFRRHQANAQDFNRTRADFLTGALLCDPISDRPLDLMGVELPLWDDPATVADALNTVDTCVACHQTLDPIASTMFGFVRSLPGAYIQAAHGAGCAHVQIAAAPEDGVVYADDACYPLVPYRIENESLYADFGLRPPGLFGQPVEDLADFGAAMAADRRFATCAVRRFVGWITQTDPMEVPDDVVADFEGPFRDEGLDAKALFRRIVLSDRVAIRGGDAGTELWVAGPGQLARSLHASTGFVLRSTVASPDCEPLCLGEVDLLRTEQYGYFSLLGGVDGLFNNRPQRIETPIRALAWGRVSARAADALVAADLALPDPADRRLFTAVRGTEGDDDAAIDVQIRQLFEVLTATPPSDADVADLRALFDQGRTSADIAEGWRWVLLAVLRDPLFLHY